MNKRPYIDCPLWAAIAAKYHGIKMLNEKIQHLLPGSMFTDVGLCWEVIDEDKLNGRQERYYIHPDSYDKLKPQQGDIGIDADGVPAQYNDGSEPYLADRIGFLTDEGIDIGECTIVCHNRMPFPPIKWEEIE